MHFSTVFVHEMKIVLMNEPLSNNLASWAISLWDHKKVANVLPFSHSKQFVVIDNLTFEKDTLANAIILFAWNDKLEHFSTAFLIVSRATGKIDS